MGEHRSCKCEPTEVLRTDPVYCGVHLQLVIISVLFTMADEQSSGLRALLQAFSMIIASEIGDKTFLIAAVLAMRHDRVTVFAGAFGSLLVMSVLSAGIGRILPTLIPRRLTQLAAAVLFLAFGVKMLLEGRQMTDSNEKMQEEMREAEEEIEGNDALADGTHSNGGAISLESLEGGRGRSDQRRSPRIKFSSQLGWPKGRSPPSRPALTTGTMFSRIRRSCYTILGPIFVQSFILTFLGEWGDRSQIATIALAAAHDVFLVAFGTVVGHACCTGLAVLGGRWISTKISVKKVTLGGACLFLIFSFLYFVEALYTLSPSMMDSTSIASPVEG